MKRLLGCVLLVISTTSLIAQDQNSALARLSDLGHSGQIPQLIQAADSLLASGNLSPVVQGIVLTWLADAYQETGDFQQATASYEKALAIINRDGRHAKEYGIALSAFAVMYAESGDADAAKHVLLRSVRLLQKQGAHLELASTWNNLAALAAEAHSRRNARNYMEHALAEAQLAPNLSPDAIADLTTTQARIAELDHDPTTAIQDYQRALDLWKQSHGDQNVRAAWLDVLMGRAYLQAGDLPNAREMTLRGLQILQTNPGPLSPRFLQAELDYSKILQASGASGEASTLRKQAEAALTTASHRTAGEISISALR